MSGIIRAGRYMSAFGICLTISVGCDSGDPDSTADVKVQTSDPEEQDDFANDAGEAGSDDGPVASSGELQAFGQLRFRLPEGWQEHPPTSGMRAAQAVIPGEAGPAEMVLFYFGPGQGGAVEANLERWIGQVQQAEGAEPERDSFQVGALTVTHVTVHGTLMPTGMGSGPTEPQPDSTLMAAVVEGPGGPWFFKVTGPAETLEEERQTFLDMLHTVRPPA